MARTPGSYIWSRWTKELVWGTFNGTGSTPDVAATVMWVPLREDAFALDADPKRWRRRTADGSNILTQGGTQRYGVTGNLKVDAYPAVVANLIPMAFTPTGSGAAVALDSWTVDVASYEVGRTLGVVATKGTVESQDSDTDPLAEITLELLGRSQSFGTVTLVQPALSVYPYNSTRPFAHNDLTLSLFGSGRTGIRRARVEVNNIVYAPFFESTTISRASYNGRNTMAQVDLADPATADRTRFEQQTVGAFTLAWNNSGATKSMTFNGQANAVYDARKDTRKFNEDMMVGVTLLPFRDTSSGTEMAVTIV